MPKAEAGNIIKSALYQPLKADFDGDVKKHKDAFPLGPITNVYEGIDDDREVLIAEAVIWNDHFEDVAEYLKKRTAENDPVGQSWELYFAESYTDDQGNEWLTDCVFGAACLVSDPAYGSTRTRILTVAEENNELQKEESYVMEEERTEISNLQSMLSSMFGMLDELWYKTYEIEEAEMVKTENVDTFASRLNDLVSKLTDRANQAGIALAETQTKLTDIQSELDTLKAEKAQAEITTKIEQRRAKLAEIDITLEEENKENILSLDDTAFDLFISSLKQVRATVKTTAETKIKLPDPVVSQEVTVQEIKDSHKALYKR